MVARLYDYIERGGPNPIASWLQGLPKAQLAKVNAKLSMLSRYGHETLPNFVTPAVGSGTIKEIVIKGNRALRLLFCRGPIEIGRNGPNGKKHKPSIWAAPEFTFLLGAEERDNRYVPRDAVQQAVNRRTIIMNDPSRRVPHVHVGPTDGE